jgi:hypothetical protein
MTLCQCQSVRQCPKILKIWQTTNFNKGFQRNDFRSKYEKGLFLRCKLQRKNRPFFFIEIKTINDVFYGWFNRFSRMDSVHWAHTKD